MDILADDRENAISRPRYLKGIELYEGSTVHSKGKKAYDGAVSATITVNFRSRAAAFRNDSTVRDFPMVRTMSLPDDKSIKYRYVSDFNALRMYMISGIFCYTFIDSFEFVNDLLNGINESGLDRRCFST